MARTKAFRSGNSQAVRIPSGLAYSPADVELEISRHGDVITMFPVRLSLKDAVEKLLAMPKPAGWSAGDG
jgi:antitoxin VapB